MGKHSQFVAFPITLFTVKEEEKEIDDDEDDSDDDDDDDENDKDEASVEVSDKKKEKKEKKTETVKKEEWELLNKQKPIWTRNPNESRRRSTRPFISPSATTGRTTWRSSTSPSRASWSSAGCCLCRRERPSTCSRAEERRRTTSSCSC